MRFVSVSILAAATVALASPVEPRGKMVVLPLRKVHTAQSAKALVDHGQAKLREINGEKLAGNVDANSAPITNGVVSYVASVTVGGVAYDLVVDTGSSNTWVGAQNQYQPGPTAKDTGGSVYVQYGSAVFLGEEYIDSVSFGGLTVSKQSIGAALISRGLQSGIDGIFGVGPVALTQKTVNNSQTVPTFMDNLYSQGSISQEVLGISFRPESGSDANDANGELTIGGTDSSKYTGSLSYFPSPGPFWGVSVSSFQYGTKSLGAGSGIVDTGTTFIYLPSSVYKAFLSAAGGKDDGSGMASFTKKPTSNFVININGVSYTLTPAQYLVPQAQYSNLQLSPGKYYAWFTNGGSGSSGVVIGQKFLENYYSVYDTNNARVGFAPNA